MSLRLKFFAVLLLGFFSARSIGTALADPPQSSSWESLQRHFIRQAMFAEPQASDSCAYSSDCEGMCKVWNPQKSLFVCEPKQYAVAVWDNSCIDKIEPSDKARVEAPLVDGEPDRKHSKLVEVVVTFKKGCTWRYEVRSH